MIDTPARQASVSDFVADHRRRLDLAGAEIERLNEELDYWKNVLREARSWIYALEHAQGSGSQEEPMTKLNELIADAQALEARAAQDRQAALAAQCEAARVAIVAAFGGLWDELAPYADEGHYWTQNGQVTTWWTVVAPPGLAPFSAALSGEYRHAGAPYLVAADSPQIGWTRYPFKELPEFLLGQKCAWEKGEAEARAARIAEARRVFDTYVSPRDNPAEADLALAKLLILDPDNGEQWKRLCAAWHRKYDSARTRRDVEEAEKARQAAAVAEYEAAFTAFWAEHQRVLEVNRGRLDALQAELDRPFTAHELTYAYCAADEDGNQFAATDTAWSLSDRPDGDGYWPIAEGGSLVRRRYYHLVSLSAPVEMRPGERRVYAAIHLDAPPEPGWYTLYVHPAADRGEIACQAAALLEPWPAWPLAPEGLDHYALTRIQSRITDGQVVAF